MSTPLLLGPIGLPELIVILVLVVVLFGGSRLAGLGKGVGRSIREFKEEVKGPEGEIEASTADGVQPPSQPTADPVQDVDARHHDGPH